MKHFFIIALPRCRTAWLANMLTTDRSICFHDLPILEIEKLKCFLESQQKEYVGLTRTIPMGVIELADAFPGSPIVTIERPIDESAKSMVAAFEAVQDAIMADRDGTITRMMNLLEAQKRNIETLAKSGRAIHEHFNTIDPERIWSHCLPEAQFDKARVNILKDMKIVTNITSKYDIHKVMEEQPWA